ncbi:MAG: hypothetical protein ABW012_00720, partial [Gaiellaceae bacterium]
EAMVVTHRLFFAPKTLVAIPMTIKLLPETLRKRRVAKGKQKMDPRAFRRWLETGSRPRGERPRTSESVGDAG